MRIRAKICGITRAEDALSAIDHGADAIGLVFYEPSPRSVHLAQAINIVKVIPPFISVVGLFVNASADLIRDVTSQVRLDLLQFHGDESPEECGRYGLPYIKAIRVKADTNLVQCSKDYANAKALLLDTYTEGVAGGTGLVFDWDLIPAELDKPVILAGGLCAENVQDAIAKVNPYAVDVSGGVECAKGIKDAVKIAAFMQQIYTR